MILDAKVVTAYVRRQRFTTPDDLATARHSVGVILRSGICEPAERDTLWRVGARIDAMIRNRWSQIPQPALYAREDVPA